MDSRYNFILSILLLFPSFNQAQVILNPGLYDHVKKCTLINNDLKNLVTQLTQEFGTDEIKKAESIYLWIKLNIVYDYEKIDRSKADELGSDTLNTYNILSQKKGVCEDFSYLTQQMFSMAAIKCEIITGLARSSSSKMFEKNTDDLHSWNSVYVKGNWILLDCTWASVCWLNEDSTDFYFAPRPDQLIYSHFPDDFKYSYLNKQITLIEFRNFPFVQPALFLEPTWQLPPNGYINTTNDFVELSAFINVDSSISTELHNISNDEITSPDIIPVRQNGHIIKFRIPIREKGKYILSVSKKNRIEHNLLQLHQLISFGITYK